MGRVVGFKGLKDIVETAKSIGRPPHLPPGVRSDALAKLCWHEWSEYWDKPWYDPRLTLLSAKEYLLNWIRDQFEGGRGWVKSADFHEFKDNSPEFALHQTLDRSGKFALASRYLHAFVVRGEPKLVYAKRTKEDGSYQLEMGPLGAHDDGESPELD